MAPLLPEHHHDIALLVEFVRYFWPHDRLVGSDQRTREAAKQIGILWRVPPILVFGTSVRRVDADADIFFGRQDRRQHLDVLDLIIAAAGGRRARPRQRSRPTEMERG